MTDRSEPTFYTKLYARLRGQIRIDQMRMDEELIESADLIMTASEYCALAIAARDVTANDLKVVMSQRAGAIRSRVVAGKRRSESEIASLLQSDKQVIEAMEANEKARLDAALWTALVDAARYKHSSLKRMAEMIVSGYLSTTSVVNSRRKEINKVRQDRRGEND